MAAPPATGIRLFKSSILSSRPAIKNRLQETDEGPTRHQTFPESYTPLSTSSAGQSLRHRSIQYTGHSHIERDWSLVTDYLQREATAYTFDVTGYLTGQLTIAMKTRMICWTCPLARRHLIGHWYAMVHPFRENYLKLYYLSIKKPNPWCARVSEINLFCHWRRIVF